MKTKHLSSLPLSHQTHKCLTEVFSVAGVFCRTIWAWFLSERSIRISGVKELGGHQSKIDKLPSFLPVVCPPSQWYSERDHFLSCVLNWDNTYHFLAFRLSWHRLKVTVGVVYTPYLNFANTMASLKRNRCLGLVLEPTLTWTHSSSSSSPFSPVRPRTKGLCSADTQQEASSLKNTRDGDGLRFTQCKIKWLCH